MHGAAFGRFERAGVGCAALYVVFIEGGLVDSPLHEELFAAIVLNDTQGRLGLKMIHATFAHALVYAAACIPHLHGKIIVAAYAGAQLYAVAASDEPVPAVYDGGRPGGACPVGLVYGWAFFEQGGLVEGLYALAIVAVNDAGVVVVDGFYHGG